MVAKTATKAAATEPHKPFRAPGRIRGVTKAQYLALSRMVRYEETTWEELERRGIVLPPQRESDFRRHVRQQLRKG